MAEITVIHVIQLAAEHGCPVTRDHALAFLNEDGRAYEMWVHMMRAGEDFIKRNLQQTKGQAVTPGVSETS